jgi:hypothetical protein
MSIPGLQGRIVDLADATRKLQVIDHYLRLIDSRLTTLETGGGPSVNVDFTLTSNILANQVFGA